MSDYSLSVEYICSNIITLTLFDILQEEYSRTIHKDIKMGRYKMIEEEDSEEKVWFDVVRKYGIITRV